MKGGKLRLCRLSRFTQNINGDFSQDIWQLFIKIKCVLNNFHQETETWSNFNLSIDAMTRVERSKKSPTCYSVPTIVLVIPGYWHSQFDWRIGNRMAVCGNQSELKSPSVSFTEISKHTLTDPRYMSDNSQENGCKLSRIFTFWWSWLLLHCWFAFERIGSKGHLIWSLFCLDKLIYFTFLSIPRRTVFTFLAILSNWSQYVFERHSLWDKLLLSELE